MNTLPKIPSLNAFTGRIRFVKAIGRILLALTAMLLITMPATQHFWTWDHFLRGGHDYELGTLMLLSLMSLALVLAKHCKQCIDSLFASWALLRFHCCDSSLTKTSESALCASRARCSAPAGIDIYGFPLQI
jgi:hypothetical protein